MRSSDWSSDVCSSDLIVLALLAGVQDDRSLFDSVWGFVAIVVLIAGVLPSWAVKIRRLHDQDRSGWWSLATAIPYVGWIATIIIGLLPGTPGENEYGFDPRTDGPDAEEKFRSEEHTSSLQSLMRTSHAVLCLNQ